VEPSLQRISSKFLRPADSKRRALLGNHFSERIYYMFLISKCRGDQDLGLYTILVLAFGEPQRNGKIRFFLRQNTFFFRILPLRYISPDSSTVVVTDLDLGLLYILISETYGEFARKIISWRSVFPFRTSARALAAGLPRQDHVYKTMMKYVVNWIPLRIHVRSRNTQPHLKGGPEPTILDDSYLWKKRGKSANFVSSQCHIQIFHQTIASSRFNFSTTFSDSQF